MKVFKALFRCAGLTLYGVNFVLLSVYALRLIDPSFVLMNETTLLMLSPLLALVGVKLALGIKNNVRTLWFPMALYACLFFVADKTLLSASLFLVVAGYLLEDFIAVQVLDAIAQQEKTRKRHSGTFAQDLWLKPNHARAPRTSQSSVGGNKPRYFDPFDPISPFDTSDPANPLNLIYLSDDDDGPLDLFD